TFQAGQALLDRRPRPCSSHHHCWLRLLEGADRAGLLLILSQVGLRLSLRLSVPIEGLPRQLVLAPASGQLSTPKPAGRFLLPALAFGEQQVLVRYSPAQLFGLIGAHGRSLRGSFGVAGRGVLRARGLAEHL